MKKIYLTFSGIFPSGNFPNVQFPKLQLPKSALAAALSPQLILAAALGPRCSLRRLRRPYLTFEKLSLGMLPLRKLSKIKGERLNEKIGISDWNIFCYTIFLDFDTFFYFVTLYIPLVSTQCTFKFSSSQGGEVFQVVEKYITNNTELIFD